MYRRRAQNRQWLLALLIVALLGGTAHAAQYGSGPHTHDGVACTFGLGADGDLCLAHSPSNATVSVGVLFTLPLLQQRVHTRVDELLPPSTGPPNTH